MDSRLGDTRTADPHYLPGRLQQQSYKKTEDGKKFDEWTTGETSKTILK